MIGRFAQIRGCRDSTTAEVGTGMSDAVAEQCAHVLAAASASGSDGSAARVRAAELSHEVRDQRQTRGVRARGVSCAVWCVPRVWCVCVCLRAQWGVVMGVLTKVCVCVFSRRVFVVEDGRCATGD